MAFAERFSSAGFRPPASCRAMASPSTRSRWRSRAAASRSIRSILAARPRVAGAADQSITPPPRRPDRRLRPRLSGPRIRIVDEHGKALPERRRPDRRARTLRHVRLLRRPVASGETLRAGWLQTGDLGYLADGELFVCGRTRSHHPAWAQVPSSRSRVGDCHGRRHPAVRRRRVRHQPRRRGRRGGGGARGARQQCIGRHRGPRAAPGEGNGGSRARPRGRGAPWHDPEDDERQGQTVGNARPFPGGYAAVGGRQVLADGSLH